MPLFQGALTEEDATPPLNDALDELYAFLAEAPLAKGMLCAKVVVEASGSVQSVGFTCDTLSPVPGVFGATEVREQIMAEVAGTLLHVQFPPADGTTTIAMPFIFD